MFSSPLTFVFIVIATSCISSWSVFSQDIPSIACPNMFEYLSYDNNYIGKITLYAVPFSSIKVEAQFSQREPITTTYSGRISLIEGLQSTQSNLENGQPISYRVDFPNPHLLPKLTRIKLNGQTICADNGLPPPSTVFQIHHIFYPSPIATFSRPVNRPTTFVGNNNNPIEDYYNNAFGKDPNNFFNPGPFQTPPKPARPNNQFLGTQQIPTVRPTIRPTIPPPPPPPTAAPPTRAAPTRAAPNLATTCGQEGSSLTPFIVGGNEFERGRFPWLAAIYLRQGADLKFICGGSLISTRTVITAAHCFLDARIAADRIVVYLGRHNLYSSEIGVEQRDVQVLVKHPEFNASAMSDADIALLQVNVPVRFTQFIRPICLFTSGALSNNVAYVAGWGNDNAGREVTPVPKVVEVDIVSEAECLRSSDIFSALTSRRSLCAGKRDGTGPCIGDSGGGLMVSYGGRWILRAITSLGITDSPKACNLQEYVVYCDLSKHSNWVQQNMLT